ncbi:bath-42 [Symbiodinium microadriaticum]|nr:bath-42 [Symbiodinium microadriaticum]
MSAGVVYAHSLVLKAVSPVLKALLSSPMLEGATGVIQVEGVGVASVHLLLQLLYTGTTPDADHDPSVLLGTLDLAHRWQAAHVVDIVEGALVKKIKLENLGAFCETALLKGLPTLRNACKRFAQSSTEAANVSRILQSKDFPQCARDELSAPKPPQKRRRRHP